MAISINAPSGNIDIVLDIYTYTPSAYLKLRSIFIRPVVILTQLINLTYMLSGNLNSCAINKYANTLRDDN